MIRLFHPSDNENGKLQSQLMRLAALFLALVCTAITLAPAVRLHSWKAELRFNQWIGFGVWLISFSCMHYFLKKRFASADPFLLPITALLSGWGLITIWRLNSSFGMRQSIWLLIAAVIFWAGTRYPSFVSLLRRYKYIWLISGLALTGLTFIFGTYPGGTGPDLWLHIFNIYIQPSEPLKLLLIVYLSAYFADQTALKLNSLRLLAPTLILIGAACFLLLAQRDLGTGLVFILIYFSIAFLASENNLVPLFGSLFVIGASILGYYSYPVIQGRVNTWLNPWLDPMTSSYQIVQSLIAIASGGLLGRGAGLGTPTLVPISHSDFIFTAIAEEYGLVGSLGLILLFVLLAFRTFYISIYAPNNYRRYLAAGLGTYFSIQALLIIGGNLNLLPLAGITLPFVSYGGSSLIVSFSAVIILIIISDQIEVENTVPSNIKPYVLLGGVFLSAWLVISLASGFWPLLRSNELLTRSDNLRQAINDFYVPRGNLVDRNNESITETSGERGDYQVTLTIPELSNVAGYSNIVYGQAGLEASLDAYLRGLQGNPSSLIWSHSLLYSQRPPGLDVRLSLDVNLQSFADELLTGNKGAVVLINAQTGEILTLASSPTYNTNHLEEYWAEWNEDPDAPFLNRATQGQYYAEIALAPFILYKALENGSLPQVTPAAFR